MMRVFVAIGLDNQTRKFLVHHQNRISCVSSTGKLTQPENFHLTFEFIGEVSDRDITQIIEAMDGISSSRFTLTCDSLGKFDRAHRGLWWIHIKTHTILVDLQKNLRERLRTRGLRTDNGAYTPHITLAREVRMEAQSARSLLSTPIPPFTFPVDRIHLMQSSRRNGKLVYESIHEHVLTL